MSTQPADSAKNVKGDSDTFTSFMQRLMQVPHSEIKAKLDAERKTKRKPKHPSSRASASSSKVR